MLLLHLVKEGKLDDGFDTNTLGLFTLFFSKMIVYYSWDFQMCIGLVVANYKTCIDQSTSHKINSNWGFLLGPITWIFIELFLTTTTLISKWVNCFFFANKLIYKFTINS